MRRLAPLAIAALLASSSPAAAQPAQKAAAKTVFDEGKLLLAEGKIEAACRKFEESLAIVEQLGTRLNLADCYERLGKLTAAYTTFKTAEPMAVSARDLRVPYIRERLASLERRLALLVITLTPGTHPPTLKVTRNGSAVDAKRFDAPFPVETGSHVVAAEAPGYQSWSTTIEASPGTRRTVEIPALRPQPTGGPPPGASVAVQVPAPEGPRPSRRTRQIISIAVGGAGLVTFAAGVYIARSALSDWNDLKDSNLCDDGGGCRTAEATRQAEDARSQVVVGDVVGGVGLVAVATGVSLYYFWARRAERDSDAMTAVVTPVVGPDRAGLALTAEF